MVATMSKIKRKFERRIQNKIFCVEYSIVQNY